MTAPMPREELPEAELKYLEDNIATVAWHLGRPGASIAVSYDNGVRLIVDAGAVFKEISRRIDHGVAQKAGWQPIETKRADHFPVLIDGPYGIHTAFQDVTWTWYVRGGIELDYTPTHWRPLPERASNQGASK